MIKKDFIQELLQEGNEKSGFDSAYSMDKRGFVAKEQGGVPWMENYSEGNIRSKGNSG